MNQILYIGISVFYKWLAVFATVGLGLFLDQERFNYRRLHRENDREKTFGWLKTKNSRLAVLWISVLLAFILYKQENLQVEKSNYSQEKGSAEITKAIRKAYLGSNKDAEKLVAEQQ